MTDSNDKRRRSLTVVCGKIEEAPVVKVLKVPVKKRKNPIKNFKITL